MDIYHEESQGQTLRAIVVKEEEKEKKRRKRRRRRCVRQEYCYD